MQKYLPIEKLRSFSRRVVHEGVVLLENKKNILPLINKRVALFGRIQTNYYKSGTGSGGLVNVSDCPSFVDAVLENPRLNINENVLNYYYKWIENNPFDAGTGKWASEPWSQVEMPLSEEEIINLKRDDEVGVVIIGRTAGEDRDNFAGEGSYFLTKLEYELIKNVKSVYKQVVVILNVGNVIDTNFAKELDVDGLIYAWHGGQDGARATIDVLTGYINPSGKLPNTLIKDLNKYPPHFDFGNEKEVFYKEDIYVGYRFFETFMPEEVLYPFGFGLSYTNFEIETLKSDFDSNFISLEVKVTNVGNYYGKEVVQIYFSAPFGLLGKAKRELVAFAKTKVLYENEYEVISFKIDINKLASYDDVGIISKSSYVLEKGKYQFFVGSDIRNNHHALIFELKDNIIVEKLSENMAPVNQFKRIKPNIVNGQLAISYEDVPIRQKALEEKVKEEIKENSQYKNDNYQLIDVYNQKITIEQFVQTLTFEDLSTIILGEGMSSPKVTPGTASAFGGVTKSLLNKGVEIICCADGPSGIRMDSGALATSMPNGTLLASTFNLNLVEDLYELEALEMLNYDIDILLGPGLNIHRHPLNGRNFEYFSEDPLLSGMMTSSVIRGLNNMGVTGAMKHFTANNQEQARTEVNANVSERALREIYLKGYEIAVKESKASVIMTSYNGINGVWAASNFDLNTSILRNEWNYQGIVMTDWWAKMNNEGEEANKENLKALVRAQNDLYMVTPNALTHQSNLKDCYLNGEITLYELQRNAMNILNFIMLTPKFKKAHNIKITSLSRQIDKWFETNKQKNVYSFLPLETKEGVTTLSKSLDSSVITKNIVVENKNDISFLLINNSEQTLYNFGIEVPVVLNDVYELIKKGVKGENVLIGKQEVTLNLKEVNLVNKKANTSWLDIQKDAIYVYKIKSNQKQTYQVDIDISSTQTSITQMPFSLYLNERNVQTLIPNGTGGKIQTITCFIEIAENVETLSFKFNKTGLDIHKITIKKGELDE